MHSFKERLYGDNHNTTLTILYDILNITYRNYYTRGINIEVLRLTCCGIAGKRQTLRYFQFQLVIQNIAGKQILQRSNCGENGTWENRKVI